MRCFLDERGDPPKSLTRDGKSCKRYKRCWCKEFPTGVKILVESVINSGVKNLLCWESRTFGVNFWVLKNSWCKFLPFSISVVV